MPKRILVTGAGSGFGRGASLGLAARGHDVIATVHRKAQEAGLRKEAVQRGLQLKVETLDLLNEADQLASVAWEVDVLVNNAAIGEGGPIAEIPLDRVRQVFEVNVFATLELTQRLVPAMVKQGHGRVVFVSSIAGLTAGAYLGAYAASKHALEAIAESMSRELAPHGVDVVTLNPGPYATGFNDQMVASMGDWYDPARHFTRPDDLASLPARFAHQHDPAPLIHELIALTEADTSSYRNVHPIESEHLVRNRQREAWDRQVPPHDRREG